MYNINGMAELTIYNLFSGRSRYTMNDDVYAAGMIGACNIMNY